MKKRKRMRVICFVLAIAMLIATVAMVFPAHAMETSSDMQTYTETSFRDISEIIRQYFSKWFPVKDDSTDNTEESTEEITALESPVITVTGSFNKERQFREIDIEWEAVSGADKYIVQLSLNKDFTDIYREKETTNDYYNYVFASAGTAPYYFPANATYYIRVKAVSGDMESEWSNVVVSGV